jgi:hypothetical protein
MTTAVLFLLISLDKPYQGDFIIGPEIYQALLTQISK